MKPLFDWRHAYDQTRDKKEGELAELTCEDPSLTVQSFSEDADINVLARRFGLTEIPFAPVDENTIVDTTEFPDLRAILEARRSAANHFANLPIKIRKRFRNSPEELWNFLQDPENADEAVRLGLLTRHAPAGVGTATPDNPTASKNAPTPASGDPSKEPRENTEKTPKDTPASK